MDLRDWKATDQRSKSLRDQLTLVKARWTCWNAAPINNSGTSSQTHRFSPFSFANEKDRSQSYRSKQESLLHLVLHLILGFECFHQFPGVCFQEFQLFRFFVNDGAEASAEGTSAWKWNHRTSIMQELMKTGAFFDYASIQMNVSRRWVTGDFQSTVVFWMVISVILDGSCHNSFLGRD